MKLLSLSDLRYVLQRINALEKRTEDIARAFITIHKGKTAENHFSKSVPQHPISHPNPNSMCGNTGAPTEHLLCPVGEFLPLVDSLR